MSWTRTPGCSSSMPRTSRVSTRYMQTLRDYDAAVPAGQRSPSSTCASSATICVRWPSPRSLFEDTVVTRLR